VALIKISLFKTLKLLWAPTHIRDGPQGSGFARNEHGFTPAKLAYPRRTPTDGACSNPVVGPLNAIASRPGASVAEGLPHQVPTDHDPLNLTRAFPDLTNLGVSHHPFHGVVLGITHPPEELDGLGRGPHAEL